MNKFIRMFVFIWEIYILIYVYNIVLFFKVYFEILYIVCSV